MCLRGQAKALPGNVHFGWSRGVKRDPLNGSPEESNENTGGGGGPGSILFTKASGSVGSLPVSMWGFNPNFGVGPVICLDGRVFFLRMSNMGRLQLAMISPVSCRGPRAPRASQDRPFGVPSSGWLWLLDQLLTSPCFFFGILRTSTKESDIEAPTRLFC